MTTHVLVRLKTYYSQIKINQNVNVEILHSIMPDLKVFCMEEQNGADLLLRQVRMLERNNELLKKASISDEFLKSLQDQLYIIRSQLNTIDVILKLSSAVDKRYTALVDNDAPSGPLRVVKPGLIDIEKKLKELEKILGDEIKDIPDREKAFDEAFDRASQQSREHIVTSAFQSETASRKTQLQKILRASGVEIATILKGVIPLYTAYSGMFIQARDHIAKIEKEFLTNVPQARILFQESFGIGELLL